MLLALYVNVIFGWSQAQFGLVLMACAVVYAVGQLVVFDPLQRRFGLGPLGAIASVAGGGGQLCFFLMDGAPTRVAYALFFVGLLIGIVGMTLTDGVVSPAISRVTTAEQQGTTLSMGSIAAYAGKLGAPILFGYLYDTVSHGMPFLVAGIAGIVGAVGCVVYVFAERADGAQLPGVASRSSSDLLSSGLLTAEESQKARAAADGIETLQNELKEILISRRYKTHVPATVVELIAVLDLAFPPTAEPEDEQSLLGESDLPSLERTNSSAVHLL